MAVLTKSKYVQGINCSKQIWLLFNDKTRISQISESLQHRFDEGHLVGELAKSLYPKGIDLEEIKSRENVVSKSKDLLKKRRPLFEAGFVFKNCYSRADILVPVNDDEWDVYEVKSGTKVKDDNLNDISFQKYCYDGSSLKIRKCFVLHINNQYVRNGDIEPKELFVATEVTELVEELLKDIEYKIDEMIKVIKSPKCPEMDVGKYCEDPYECHHDDKFWKKNSKCNILSLYRGGKKSVELFNQGVLELRDIPKSVKLNKKQITQIECDASNQTHLDKGLISEFLDTAQYPLYFLDFETYSTAIPLYDNLKPYQRIPFQFSLHIVNKKGDNPVHHSFIAQGNQDPREEFINTLKSLLGKKGSIVVYNQGFEKGVLREVAEVYTQYEVWVNSIDKRFWDLLVPFQSFSYYNPSQKGSASIKRVLPAVTGESYSDLEIGDGETASRKYLYVIHKNKTSKEERKKVMDDLEIYCSLDTEGMIWIFDKLKEITK